MHKLILSVTLHTTIIMPLSLCLPVKVNFTFTKAPLLNISRSFIRLLPKFWFKKWKVYEIVCPCGQKLSNNYRKTLLRFLTGTFCRLLNLAFERNSLSFGAVIVSLEKTRQNTVNGRRHDSQYVIPKQIKLWRPRGSANNARMRARIRRDQP